MTHSIPLSWANEAYNTLTTQPGFSPSGWPQSQIDATKQHFLSDPIFQSVSSYRLSPSVAVKNGQVTPPDDLSPIDSTEQDSQLHQQVPPTVQPKQIQTSFTHEGPSPCTTELWIPRPVTVHPSALSPVEAQTFNQLGQLEHAQFQLRTQFETLEQSGDSEERWREPYPEPQWPSPNKQSENLDEETIRTLFPDLDQEQELPNTKPSPPKRRRQTKRAVPEPTPKPTQESPEPKRRRGRPKSQPPAMDPVALDTNRQTHLEKNRIAAHKCRQRKKEFINSLEENSKKESIQNKQLKNQVDGLKEEVLQLKNEVLRHAGCGDVNIDRYLKQSASNIINMDQRGSRDTTTGSEQSQEWAQPSPPGGSSFMYSNDDGGQEISAANTPLAFDPTDLKFFEMEN